MNETKPVVLTENTKNKIYENLKKYADLDISVDLENVRRIGSTSVANVKCNKCGEVSTRKTANLCTYRYHCKGCKIEEYKTGCTSLGKEYVSHINGRSGVCLTAKCSSCGILSTFDPLNFKDRAYRKDCPNCLVEKYKNKCLDSGKTYVSHETKGKATKITVMCNTCKGVRTIQPSSLQEATYRIKCPSCLLAHTRKITEDAGYDFVAKINSGALVRCRHDGSEMEFTNRHLEEKNTRCDTCLLNKHIALLSARNCHFIEYIRAEKVATRVRYSTPQGDVLDTSLIALSAGRFATNTTGQWFTPHSTYLIRLEYEENVYYKIGTAQLPEKRLEWLRLNGKSEVFTIMTFGDRFSSDKLESELHKEFAEYKLDPKIAALFTTRELRVKRAGRTQRVTIKDGSTEWFTSEVFPILSVRYNLKEQHEFNNNTTGASSRTR